MAKRSKLGSVFVENFKDVSLDQAEQEIIKCLQKIGTIKEEMAADAKLAELKEQVKDLSGGYRSVIKVEKSKIDFFMERIQEIQTGAINPTSGAN